MKKAVFLMNRAVNKGGTPIDYDKAKYDNLEDGKVAAAI